MVGGPDPGPGASGPVRSPGVGIKRALNPAVGFLDRRIDWRIEKKLEERLPHYAAASDLAALSESLTKVYGELLTATTDVKRWMADDLDVAQETATLLGRSLDRLSAAVEQLKDEVGAVVPRLERLEAGGGPGPS